MSDLRLTWDTTTGAADFEFEDNDIVLDDGLETSVIESLFTDRRAEEGDVLPLGETDRRGWWGDEFPDVAGDRIGSRLWLLGRAKQTQEVLDRAREYTLEALQWMIEDKVTDRVDVESGIVANGVLAITITIHRPEADSVTFRFDYTWAAQELRGA